MTTTLRIIPDGDGAWANLVDRGFRLARRIEVAGLTAETSGDRPSVTILFELEDGTYAIGQTTLRLFLTAADALKARHGDPREGT